MATGSAAVPRTSLCTATVARMGATGHAARRSIYESPPVIPGGGTERVIGADSDKAGLSNPSIARHPRPSASDLVSEEHPQRVHSNAFDRQVGLCDFGRQRSRNRAGLGCAPTKLRAVRSDSGVHL